MGVTGLLPAVSSAAVETDLDSLADQTAGVDIYSWLHKATFSCASALVEYSGGSLPRSFLSFIVHRVNLLRHHRIKPVLVFDGADLPSKAATHAQRAARREEAKHEAIQCRKKRDFSGVEAWSQKAVEVTLEIAAEVRRVMEDGTHSIVGGKVDCVTAPYEADAQLAAMALAGNLDFIITEDSDLIAYGAPAILYKMTKFGKGTLIRQDRLAEIPDLPLSNFTREMFVLVCVLSGCDFLPRGVPGLGIKKAYALVKKFRSFKRVIQVLRTNPKYGVLPDSEMGLPYPEAIRRACLVFGHQTIWNEKDRKLMPLRPLQETIGRLIEQDPDGNPVEKEWDDVETPWTPTLSPPSRYSFLGPRFEHSVAEKIARGLANPQTRYCYPASPPILSSCSLPTKTLNFEHVQTPVSLSLPARGESPRLSKELSFAAHKSPTVNDELTLTARRLSTGLSIPTHITRTAVAAGRATSAPALSQFRPPRTTSAKPSPTRPATSSVDFLEQYAKTDSQCPENRPCGTKARIHKPKAIQKLGVAELQHRNAPKSRLGLPLFHVGFKPLKKTLTGQTLNPVTQAKSNGGQTRLKFN